MAKQLNGLGELVAQFTKNTLMAIEAVEIGLEHAAKVVQEDAKDRIGEYQREIGHFPEWAPLANATKADRLAKGFTEDDPLLRSGELRDSIVTEHTAMAAVIGSKLPQSAYLEFGTEKMPPRPFLGPAALAKRKQIQRIIGTATAMAMGGNAVASIYYEKSKTED